MLTLYQGSTSVCAIKVRLTLEEKGLAFEGTHIDLHSGEQFDPEYLKLNPNAVVPTLVHDGRVIIESSIIQAYLEDTYPDPALMPDDAFDRARMRLWMKRIDDPIHPACSTLTHAISFRKGYLAKSPAEKEARLGAIPDPARKERLRTVYEQGLEAPFVVGALRSFDRLIGDMEDALTDAPWLAGPAYSLADAAATPYINRLGMLGVLEPWLEKHPRVADWFGRVRQRPSFEAAITSYFTEEEAERFKPYEPDAPQKVQ